MTIGILYFGFNLLDSSFCLAAAFVIHLAFAYDGYQLTEESRK